MTKVFDNYNELFNYNERLANELMEDVGEGGWQNEQIYFYESVEDFAEHELTEGWYASLEIDKDWNGAPNPMEYIDLTALGNALTENWDESSNFKSEQGEILSTGHGW